jgi:hypothetical protein
MAGIQFPWGKRFNFHATPFARIFGVRAHASGLGNIFNYYVIQYDIENI